MPTYKLVYKNGVTPQEYLTENSKWYLDSDIDRGLSGIGSITYSTRSYSESSITTSPSSLGTGQDFLYLKNNSDSINDILFSLDGGTNYYFTLSPGESFASKLSTDATISVKSEGKSNIEYFIAT